MQNETNHSSIELLETESTESPAIVDAPPVDLKAAREARRLSASDAAYALKVSPRVIEALEAGRWSELPGRAFAVGILRAYGRLLEISVDALVETIPGNASSVKRAATSASTQRSAPTPSRRDGETKRQTNRMLKSGLIMMLVAILLAYGVPGDFWGDAVQNLQALYERLAGDQTQSAPTQAVPVTPAAPGEQSGTPAAGAEQATGTGTLELRFAGPAWVEVRDYSGRIIYSQLNAAGTTQFITGAAPLDIMIGNAKQVQARWRDEPIKLDKLSGDDVARQILR